VLALVLALVAIASLIASPAQNLISRRVETRADVHALTMTQDPETFVRMQRSLALTSYSDPDPPVVLYGMFASHPTTPQRIALARTWAQLNSVPVPPDQAPEEPS
jgi:STE24 endopeptidase